MNLREILAHAAVVPELRIEDPAHALPLVKSLLAGGLTAMEINVRSGVALAATESVRKGATEAIIGASGLNRALDFAAAGRLNVHFGSTPGLPPSLPPPRTGHAFRCYLA